MRLRAYGFRYIRRKASDSPLCLPLLHRTKLIGVREAKIRRLVDSNTIGIVVWHLDGRLLDANDAFLRMVQYTREDLKAGLRWTHMTPHQSWQASAAGIRELVATGEMQHHEQEFFRKDGSRVPVLIGAAAFEGTPDQGVAFIVDLTERKQAEARLREGEQRNRDLQAQLAHANRIETVGQLSAWIAHDVRQPLVGIVASADAGLRWLAADPPNIPAAQRALDRVVREGHRAAEMLERIRALVKKSGPQREAVDMNAVVDETMTLIGPEADRNGISVHADFTRPLPLVLVDRIQIQQVLMNLVVNAIQAMSHAATQPRELRVTTALESSKFVLVTVSDSGPGIPAEHCDRLFEAFYTTRAEGLGMGLAICRTIVESFGGRIWMTPDTRRGTAFHFTAPLATSNHSDPHHCSDRAQ